MPLHGQAALVVIDVQKGGVMTQDVGIPHMAGGEARYARILDLVATARASDVPVVFVQEVHKRTLIDFGRELDGAERATSCAGSRGPGRTPSPARPSRSPPSAA